MTFKSLFLAGLLSLGSALSGAASTYNLGDVTNGATVTNILTKQTVDFLEFSIDAPAGFAMTALTISATSTPGSNLSEMIALYSGSLLIATASTPLGGGNTATLSFGGADILPEGSYTLAFAGWKANFPLDIAGASSTAFFGNGKYIVSIDPTITAVPLPAGGLLVLTGLGALGLARRKTRKA